MTQGFTLISDPDVTAYRRVGIATPSAGTAVLAGTPVSQAHSGSATVDVAVSTAATVTSAIYGVTVETIYAGQTSVLIAIITPRQIWACEASTATTSLTGTATGAYNGLRAILGYVGITVGTTTGVPPYTYRYLSSGNPTSDGVLSLPTGTTANITTLYTTGSDVTGTTGIFIQTGTIPSVSTTRIVGRFLVEHAA